MKKNFKKINGMTLAELMIASILVGVVIVGVLSSDFAIRTWQKRIEQRTHVQMDLARLMEQILKDGRATVGSGVCHEIGGSPYIPTECKTYSWGFYGNDIALGYEYRSNHSGICFRHVHDNGTDNKVCYNWIRTSTDPLRGDLTRYITPDTTGPILALTSKRLVKDVYCGIKKCSDSGAGPNVTSIELELCARPDMSLPKNDLTNPEYCLSTSFLPVGLSQ